MAKTKSEDAPVLNLTKPERRFLAFAEQRMIGLPLANDDSEGVQRSAKSAPSPSSASGQGFAEHHLEQLRLYRERLSETSESDISERELAVPGQYNWVPIGPSAVRKGQAEGAPRISGRVKGIAVSPDGMRIYAATANGGVWRSLDAGNSWESLMDRPDYSFDLQGAQRPPFEADSLSCGAIALVPGESAGSDIIFVGSGEPHGSRINRTSSWKFHGVGPIVSHDGGRTWVTESAALVGEAFYALATDPNHPTRVVGATTDGLYRREPSAADMVWEPKAPPAPLGAGVTGWMQVTSVVSSRRGGDTTFFAAAFYERTLAGGQSTFGAVVYASDDGDVWRHHGSQLPNTRVETIRLAVLPDNPDVVYALMAYAGTNAVENPERGAFRGLYRCARGGKWVRVTVPDAITKLFGPDPSGGGQGNYDNTIAVAPHPNDPNKEMLILGGSGLVSASGEWVSALFRCEITIGGTAANPTATAVEQHIGLKVHADIHTAVFRPNNFDTLWVGCDGGVFRTLAARTGVPDFIPRNDGLQTITVTHMAQHPTDDAVMLTGTQDNGGQLFSGEPVWLKSFPGDAGYMVIHPTRPQEVLYSHYDFFIEFSDTYGQPYVSTPRTTGLNANDDHAFYSPLVGIKNPDAGSSDFVAFGTERIYVSEDFGQNWRGIPTHPAAPHASNSLATNQNDFITALLFQNKGLIYAGTNEGRIYKTTRAGGGAWSHPLDTKLHNKAGCPGAAPNQLFPGSVTSIIADPRNPERDIFVSIGGNDPQAGVWYYDGSGAGQWTKVEKPDPGSAGKLLSIHHNSVVALPQVGGDPTLFAGADLGVWRYRNPVSGWQPFSEGLPDAAVVDLQIIPESGQRPNLLRAGTYGRGVFQRILRTTAPETPVELYIRSTAVDQCWDEVDLTGTKRHPAAPNDPARTISAIESPDIKVDVPDAHGRYQFPFSSPGDTIHYVRFSDDFRDESQRVAAHDSSAVITSRVYVQVHNRSALTANNVQVALLITPATAPTLPDFPANHLTEIQAGRPVNSGGWTTVGIARVDDLRTSFPRVVGFDLTSDIFPPPANLTPANREFYLFAIIHHAEDNYNPADTPNANLIAKRDRKATFKKIRLEPYAGVLPAVAQMEPPPGFIQIPATATAAGAPFDSMLGFALAQNDHFIDNAIGNSFLSPFAAHENKALLFNNANPAAPEDWLRARTIRLDTELIATDQTPVIWFATEKITLNARINANGKGSDGEGDFGGSGGFGNVDGNPCRLPGSRVVLAQGGITADKDGKTPAAEWCSRALLLFQHLKGGAAGGSLGGRGGGVVCLFAPIIEFTNNGRIEASGAAPPIGPANAGGGGGGLIILIANQFINVNEAAAHPQRNIIALGGSALLAGGAGGPGIVLKKQIN